jgi:hypothetical protein
MIDSAAATITAMLGLPPGFIEAAIARDFRVTYPWLHKVARLPDGGLLAPALPWWPSAANDPTFIVS